MKKIGKIIAAICLSFGLVAGLSAAPVFADTSDDMKGNIIDCSAYASVEGGGVYCILNVVLDILTYGVGILGVIGIVISGIQYATSEGDVAKMTKAKNRIVQVVIGLVIYAVMWAALKFLIPGFGNGVGGINFQ